MAEKKDSCQSALPELVMVSKIGVENHEEPHLKAHFQPVSVNLHRRQRRTSHMRNDHGREKISCQSACEMTSKIGIENHEELHSKVR